MKKSGHKAEKVGLTNGVGWQGTYGKSIFDWEN